MSEGIVFKEGIPFNKDNYLLFSTQKLRESIAFFKTNNCENALFSPHDTNLPYQENSLDVLNEITVKRLIVFPSTTITDTSAIMVNMN